MLLDQVIGKVQDSTERLTVLENYLPAIAAALARYSKHRPLLVVADLDSIGTRDLELPPGWVTDFSTISSIEYPLEQEPESFLSADEYKIYRTPTGLKLRLWDAPPAAAASVRVTYTAVRTEADVPATDLDAIACFAAAICLRTLAALYGQSSDPTMSVDVVSYQSKTDTYRRLADAQEAKYFADLGIDPKAGPQAASATASPADPRRRHLLHHGGR